MPGRNFRKELDPNSRGGSLAAVPDNVRRTCLEFARGSAGAARVNETRAVSLADELPISEIRAGTPHMDVAAEFRDLRSAVCFHVTLHLFNFGHGFRHPLHEVSGRGAWQTMKHGVEAMHASTQQGLIDAPTLADLTEDRIRDLFGLTAVGTPETNAQLAVLARMILEVGRSAGRRLLELGHRSFAEFVSAHTAGGVHREPSAVALVRALAESFPAFDDRRVLKDGREILFLKKAQLAAAELCQRFGAVRPDEFAFGDTGALTVACDNVLPCVLTQLGVLELDPDLARRIDTRTPLPAGREEACLRAAAITATEMMLRRNRSIRAKELGDYLWALGKDPRFRRAERHATPDTCFY